MRRLQEGVGILFLAIVLVGIMAILFGVVALFRSTTTVADSKLTSNNFAIAHRALEQFASATGRLPCPANGTLATGDADPPGASATCNSPGGTLPWRTIGMRSEDALDAWGRKITYRVYTGNSGSLTQADGASMVKCECDLNAAGAACEATPGAVTPLAGNAGGLCSTSADPLTYNVTETTFLAGKGLTVNDFGTAVTDAAYVLVSHGPSGLGGYTSSGTPMTAPGNAAEINNMQPAGPFTAQAPMTAGLAPTDPNYFDDVIAYQRLRDFIRRANLSARDWPEPAPPVTVGQVAFTNAAIAAAVGHAVAPGSLGQSAITFGNVTVSGFTGAGTGTNVSLDNSGGADAIGVAGNFSNLMSSFAGEYVVIGFTGGTAQKFGVTLSQMGTYVFLGTTYTERVQFTFFNAGVQVGSPVVKSGCRADGGLASYSINVGSDYDSVEVRPITATPSGFPTSLGVAEIIACTAAASSCLTSLDAVANECP